MRQCKHKMEVGDTRDHFGLTQGDPSLFVKISAARTVAVSTGAGTHFNTSAFFAADKGIPEFPCLACGQGIHDLQFLLRHLMGYTVLWEMGREEITEDMLLTVIFM